METSGNDNTTEEWPTSPYKVLQHISGEAVRVAGEALQGVYLGNGNSKIHPSVLGHRRTHSEVVTGLHRRTNSFQKLKSHMQRALRWGSSSSEQGPAFNPEVLANQKRQWYQLHSNSLDNKYHEPTSLFERFVVVGLHPESNLELVEEAFSKSKRWERDMEKYETVDVKLSQQQGPTSATLEPQILFKYPPGKRLAVRPKDLAAFCFPGGVKARVLERTPSFSDLNELIYGQEHLSRDDLSFIFSLKVADNATLYGVCLQVQEIVQRPPAILVPSSLGSQTSGRFSRFLVSAPRCYCVLTRVPFFELHYEMLNSIIAQDRLNRITQFVSQMSLADCIPSTPKLVAPMNENLDSSFQGRGNDWMASAIPVDNAVALTAAAAGILIDDSLQSSSCRWSPSPESCTTSESSDHSPMKDADKEDRKFMQSIDDCSSEVSDNQSDCFERIYSSNDNCIPPSAAAYIWRRSRTLERLDSFESLFSPVKHMLSDDEEDDIFLTSETEAGDDMIMEWARENKNDSLQIVCAYHSLPLPDRGGEIVFQPLDHLQGIEYRRPPVYTLGLSAKYLDHKLHWSSEDPEVNMKLAAGEEALALAMWTTATICRVLSLESVLAFFAGVLLEKQVVVVCPNLGVLSAIVLSVIPMIRPFEWQSLFLPILPERMLDFLDAPVPFIVGVQHKPTDRKMKASNLVHVNVVEDQVKTRYIPTLPRYKELVSELRPIHAKLASENCIAQRHPVYKCNEAQAEAAAHFSAVMRHYLESLCSDLRSHTITSVQSNNDRVSLLLKDSFIDSFSSKDQPFIKLFVDTQLFTVMSDSRLSTYESEY